MSTCAHSSVVALNTILVMVVGMIVVFSPLNIYPGLQKVLAPQYPGRTAAPSASRMDLATSAEYEVETRTVQIAATGAAESMSSISEGDVSGPFAEAAPRAQTEGAAKTPVHHQKQYPTKVGSPSGVFHHSALRNHYTKPGLGVPPVHSGARSDTPSAKKGGESEAAVAHPSSGKKGCLCDAAGRAFPKLQLLGAQKTGSTTLYNDLRPTLRLRIDMKCIGPDSWPCKESMWFNWPQTKPYYKLWGLCSQVPQGSLMADFSMGNFKWPYAAQGMHEEYGRLAKDVVLAVSLRDPLKRMLSAFAHGVRDKWLYFAGKTPTFEEHCRQFFKEWDQRGSAWLPEMWRDLTYRTVDQSLYGYKLRVWLDAGFHPSQFVIYPGNLYLKHRSDVPNNPVLKALRARVGDEFFRPMKIDSTKKFNEGHNHGEVNHDLKSPQLRDRLNNEIFAPSNQLLVKLLSHGAQQGMTLVGYSGEASDEVAIERWLVNNWDY